MTLTQQSKIDPLLLFAITLGTFLIYRDGLTESIDSTSPVHVLADWKKLAWKKGQHNDIARQSLFCLIKLFILFIIINPKPRNLQNKI